MSQPKFKNSKNYFVDMRQKKLIGTEPEKLILDEAGYAAFEAKRLEELKAEEEKIKLKRAEEKKRFEDQFEVFKDDDSYINDYSHFTFPKSEVLVRIFRVVDKTLIDGKTEAGLYIPEAEKQGFSRITSYGKIIKTGNNVDNTIYGPGKIVKLTDHIMGTSPNPEYNALAAAYNERGSGVEMNNLPELSSVPRFVSNLVDWDQYNFRITITEYTDEDAMTYLIPVSFVHAIIEQ